MKFLPLGYMVFLFSAFSYLYGGTDLTSCLSNQEEFSVSDVALAEKYLQSDSDCLEHSQELLDAISKTLVDSIEKNIEIGILPIFAIVLAINLCAAAIPPIATYIAELVEDSKNQNKQNQVEIKKNNRHFNQ